MRITIAMAAMASLCLLAGCNNGAANNSGNAPAAANASAPAAAVSPERRQRQIGQCLTTAPAQLPAGTNANAFCTCAVDKMLTNGTAQRDAVIECADEMHIQMQSG
jgi:hypothetical protein